MRQTPDGDWRVQETDLPSTGSAPAGSQVDHILPRGVLSRFAATASHGRLWRKTDFEHSHIFSPPTGAETEAGSIPESFWTCVWNCPHALPPNLPPVGSFSGDIRRPVARLYERMGSNTNLTPLVVLEGGINGSKGCLESLRQPITNAKSQKKVGQAIANTGASPEEFLKHLRWAVGVFEYLRSPEIVRRRGDIVDGISSDLKLIEQHTEHSKGLAAIWDQFHPSYFAQASRLARDWVMNWVNCTKAKYCKAESPPPNRDYVLSELGKIEKKIDMMRYPFED
ncbi:hypothetical protein GGS23DRAFT_566494 [Durotheca rogersii]|uniref:uncharacterized protein n=1 Tax=Durotheca rogersii TaxID=419775 RepID=UPI0022203D91|nr:uncharacterized protein GGS23DRAFT_566494 [Durotheca rogersii]KAI5863343.1 hypothetical protein GGS23DRAFT_566494 [Durotheca rogersii]